ncbi:MAG: hypothetical protein AAFV33_19205 [Chloroflexota bacterium]
MSLYPTADRFVIDTQMMGDVTQTHPVHVHPDGLLADGIGIALLFQLGRIASLAVFAPIPLVARLCLSNFDLVIFIVAVGASYYIVILPCTLTFPHSLTG